MEAPRRPLREIQAVPKTTSLGEGYSRLFGGQEEVPLTMGDRPKGKRQLNNGGAEGIWWRVVNSTDLDKQSNNKPNNR